MKKTHFLRILFPAVAAVFSLMVKTADAQKYKDRDQQNSNQEEQQTANRDNPDSLKTQSFLKRLTYGGSVDGGLADGGGFVYLAPRVGYRVTPKLQAGIGLTYLYSSALIGFVDPNTGNVSSFRSVTSIYGASVYTEYNLLKNILSNHDMLFAHLEYEVLNVQYYYDPYTYNYKRVWIDDPLVGGGYRMAISNTAYFNISVLYNLNYTVNQYFGSPYTSPWIMRLGVTI